MPESAIRLFQFCAATFPNGHGALKSPQSADRPGHVESIASFIQRNITRKNVLIPWIARLRTVEDQAAWFVFASSSDGIFEFWIPPTEKLRWFPAGGVAIKVDKSGIPPNSSEDDASLYDEAERASRAESAKRFFYGEEKRLFFTSVLSALALSSLHRKSGSRLR